MAITDRKLFRNPRPARDALNRMGGIMASSAPLMNEVQRFQQGGSVVSYGNPMSPSYITSLTGKKYYVPGSASSPSEASLLDLTKRAAEGGLGALSPSERIYLQSMMGGESALNATQGIRDYLGDSVASDIIGGAASGLGTLFSGVGSVGTELLIDEEGDQTTLGGRLASMMPSEEFLKSRGFTELGDRPVPPTPTEAAPEPRGMFQGPPKPVGPVDMSDPAVRARIEAEQRARAAMEQDGIYISDEETGAFPPSTDTMEEAVDNLMRQRLADQQVDSLIEMKPSTDFDDAEAEESKTVKGMALPKPRPENFAELVAASRAKTDEATAAREKEESRMREGQLGTIQPRTKEEIADVINNGTKEEQQSELKQLMNEFTQNAPKYEGLDKGLAIAKIGFAMAAGKDPSAIVNIAKAMEDGADMFIKDKQQRDAFNRQVQLSALQYGMGEISKERAQERLDKRTFTDFVNGSDKTITYKGVKYAPGRTIRVSNADYLANDGKLPEELITEKVYTSNQTAITAREKAAADAVRKAVENRTMSVTDQRNFIKDYTALVKRASEAETAGTLIETVIMKAPKIVGAGPALKQAGANFLGVFGVSAPKGWNAQKLAVQDLKAALQSVVPATLGSTQSANSISNRDVELLIEGFLADGIMTPNKDGTFAFVATTQETFVNGLKNGLRAVRRSQAETLQGMTAIDDQLLELYTPGGRVGSSLTAPLRKEGIFTPGGTAAKGVKINSMKQADDGIWDFVR